MRHLIALASLVGGLTFTGAAVPDLRASVPQVLEPGWARIVAARANVNLHDRARARASKRADASAPGGAEPGKAEPAAESAAAKVEVTTETVCTALQAAAAATELPVDFLTRLIWQESRFDPQAVSRAGAQGIAQFMPTTAAWRGLADPFNPIEALRESAEFLRDLRRQFGNLGLAAAAYNAGPRRVQDWLAGRGGLPRETQAYVRIITGRYAEDWASSEPQDLAATALPSIPCPEIAQALVQAARRAADARKQPRVTVEGQWAPWGVQLAGQISEGRALADYERLRRRFAAILSDRAPIVVKARVPGRGTAYRHLVRLAADTRVGAERLCGQLKAAGASCVVLRNPAPVLAGRS